MAASEGWIFYQNGRVILCRDIRTIREALYRGASYVCWSKWTGRDSWYDRHELEAYE